jgi:hypothetical protein
VDQFVAAKEDGLRNNVGKPVRTLCTSKIEMIFPKQGEWRVQAPAIGTDEVGGRLNRILVSAAATRTREVQ